MIIRHKTVPTYSSLEEIKEPIDVVVDFSSPGAAPQIEYAIEHGFLVLSGTTGYDEKQIEEWALKGGKRFYWSANYAKGIFLFSKMIQMIKEEYPLFDFIEIHASTKKDAPSGTAKMLARDLNIPYDRIQSLRIHSAPPIHELIFSSKYERINIRHEVMDSLAFLVGFEQKLKEMSEDNKNDKKII